MQGGGAEMPAWLSEAFASPAGRSKASSDDSAKHTHAGWRAALHVGVTTVQRRRARQLLDRVAGAARVAEAPGAPVAFTRSRRAAIRHRLVRRRPLLVTVDELRTLAAWPMGPTEDLPIDRQRSRLLPPPRGGAGVGRVVGTATYPGDEQPLRLSTADSLHHLHVIGPTGVGKTSLLLSLICQDMAAGHSVVVIDPRRDLVSDVLARVPHHRIDDVVVIDPADDAAPVGINPLAAPHLPADLRVDHLLAVFHALWADAWGPRMEDTLTSGLLTLTAIPAMSLAALPPLYTDAQFRARVLEQVRDPLALEPFWAWFEGLTPARRANVLAPVMNKLRTFLVRQRLRRVVGQATPRFDLADTFRRPTILLASLSAGQLGPKSSALLGSLLVSQLWQAAMGRATEPRHRRNPVMVYIDEFQDYTHLPTDLATVLAQARGYGVGLHLAHQHLGQLHPAVRSAVMANARSRIVFATQYDDAAVLVRNSERLAPTDVTGLGRYATYNSLLTNGEASPWVSGQTAPPPKPVRPPEDLRRRSRDRWGVPADAIDTDLAALTGGPIERPPRQPGVPLGTILAPPPSTGR